MPNNVWSGSAGSPVSTFEIDSDRRDLDVSNKISRLIPSATPFLTILMRARKVPVGSTEFTWFDSEPAAWKTNVASGSGGYDGATDPVVIDVGDSTIYEQHDIVKNTATGEVMRVVEDPYTTSSSNDQIKVAREVGYDSDNGTGTQMTAGSEGDTLLRLGNAIAEGGNAADSRATQPSKHFNYIQSFSHTLEGTETNENEKKKTNQSERIRQRQEKSLEHRLDIERAMLFGERMEHIDEQRRLTGGLLQFIDSKSVDVGSTNNGILTENVFEEYCEELFQYGNEKKLFVCSPRVGSIINQFARDRIDTVSGDEAYGLRLKEYQSFHGTLYITTTQTLEGDYAKMGIGIDMPNVKYRPFAGNDSTLRTNIQDNDSHSWKDEYWTQSGLEVRQEKTHALLSGVEN